MDRKKLTLLTAIFLALFISGTVIVFYGVGSAREVNVTTDEREISGTAYYVDAQMDSDTYKGTSPDKALKTIEQVNALELKPGDAVYFKKDCRWIGALHIQNSGTEKEPILYGMYGEGVNKPRIDGEGLVHATIWGEDVSHVEIRNLEVTNSGDKNAYHRGISIIAVYENVEGVKIRECYVHDVDSSELEDDGKILMEDKHWYGGIVVRARSNKNPNDREIILKDVLVEDNTVDKCSLVGISVGSTESSYKSPGLVIRGNHVSNCWGDGIILFNSVGGLIEHNVAANNGVCADMTRAFAGIWIIWSDDCVIQYNESYGMGPSNDGQGYDIDGACSGTILQYNYSHDNAGGFLLCMNVGNSDATIRYNVSVNDGGPFLSYGYSGSDELFQLNVYNNTFFTTKSIGHTLRITMGSHVKNEIMSYFRNNIFCVKNGENGEFALQEALNLMRFENNCYYGLSTVSLPAQESGQIVEEPKFVMAGTGGIGFDTLDGYKLMKDSPCFGTGIAVGNGKGVDFWGNKVEEQEQLNIGAYAGGAAKRLEGSNIALAQVADISSINDIAMMRKSTAAKLLDSDRKGVVSTAIVEDKNTEEWYEVAFDGVYDISKVVLVPTEDGSGYPVDFEIQIENEDGEWEEVYSKKRCRQPKDGEEQVYKFDTVSTQKIRIYITKLRETQDGYCAKLNEIEVY